MRVCRKAVTDVPRCGFTLIELLVVVAIIAVLIAILLPSLSKAREMTRRSMCASGMRQIAMMVTVYIEEQNDMLPWEPAPSNGGAHHPQLAMARAGYFDDQPNILHCPSSANWSIYGQYTPEYPMTTPITSANGLDSNSIHNSYVWRHFVWPYTNPYTPVPALNISEIRYPSQEWYVCDYTLGPGHFAPDGVICPSHDDEGAVVGYLDGHASWLLRQQWNNFYDWGVRPDVPDVDRLHWY